MVFLILQPQITSDLYKTFTSHAVQGKVSHTLQVLIYYFKFQEMDPKNRCFGLFSEDFGHALPLPKDDAQIFCQIKGLMKFHLDSVCGSQVINFQKFSWRWSIHELDHFGVFLGPNWSKIGSILVKLAPEVMFRKRNRVLKFFSKIPIFTETTR